MICPDCQTVNSDDARYCINCGHALPRACAVCGALNPPTARFCNQCGAPLAAGAAASSNGQANGRERPTAGAPRGKRAKDAAPTPRVADEHAEQRRIVTILFADLTSSTALAEELDPEDTRALLGAFFGTMARQIRRHGGTVEKYIGDAVMAVFGLPIAHEDDPLRAVRAALDMQAALRRFNASRRATDPNAPELQMRIGINTGDVAAAGAVAEGGDFLVTGDPVNVAARLQQNAAPGAVLVGPRTYRSTYGAVDYGALPPVALRGKTRPVTIWEARALAGQDGAPAPRPRGIAGLRATLVGRDSELELLRALCARVMRERSPQLVTLLGMPGIGKTRLAHEFMPRAPEAAPRPAALAETLAETGVGAGAKGHAGARRSPVIAARPRSAPPTGPVLLEGRCPPYGEGITYWPLAEMLRAYCDISAFEAAESARAKLLACVTRILRAAGREEEPEAIAAYLGQTVGIESAARRQALLPAESQPLQEGRLRAWRVFFEALAATSGLVALIEDIHWADDGLLDLLEYVAARAGDAPLLLLCTARPELLERRPEWGGGKRNYATIELEALAGSDMQRLVHELLPGGGVPERLRLGILAKAEGNPFYVEEIVHMLVDRGVLICQEPEGTGWRVAPDYAGSRELDDPAIPDTVQGVLLARLDLLPPAERDVLQHAAVIGRYFWASALRGLAPHLASEGIKGLDAVLLTLQERGLIYQSAHAKTSLAPPGEPIYSFNHALTREIVYSTIVRTRRAHEHARAAAWIEEMAAGREEEFADLLAQHYRQYYVQGNLARARNNAHRQAVRAKVLQYLRLAGDQAAARHAAAKAERYYTDAIALLEEESAADERPLLGEFYTQRGAVRWMALRADAAWADYAEALRLREVWCGHADAAPEAADAEEDAAAGTDAVAARAALPDACTESLGLYRQLVLLPTRYPSYFQRLPPHEDLRAYLERGLRLARESGQHDTPDYAALLTAKSFFWLSWPERRGERELLDALRSAREAVAIAERLGDPRGASEALDALGNIQAITTDLRGHLESQTRRLHWAARIDDPRELVDIHAEVSLARQMVGNYAPAAEHAQTALDLADAEDADPLRMQALRSAVLAYFEWDHWGEALASGADLLAVPALAEGGHSDLHLAALLALAIAHVRRGEQDDTDTLARRVDELAPMAETQDVEVFRGRLALARGATKEARRLWLEALEIRSGRHCLAPLLAELAELAARTNDARLYERFGAQALELGWRSGARKSLAQAIRARGIVALAAGRWDDALADAQNALGRHRELGTAWEEARTRYVLAGLYRRRAAQGDVADAIEGDQELARGELTQALAIFEGLHAVRDTARARAALSGGEIRLP